MLLERCSRDTLEQDAADLVEVARAPDVDLNGDLVLVVEHDALRDNP